MRRTFNVPTTHFAGPNGSATQAFPKTRSAAIYAVSQYAQRYDMVVLAFKPDSAVTLRPRGGGAAVQMLLRS